MALKSLRCCGQPQLESLSKCILMEIGVSSNEGDFVDFIEGCYMCEKYDECLYFCNNGKFVQSCKANSRVTLVGAKALYMLFHREVLRLRRHRALMSPEVFHNRHTKCYAKAKEIVTILSRNELTQADKEASKMLDMAIQKLITETNQLCDVQVCYLCHRNLLNNSVYDVLQSTANLKLDVKMSAAPNQDSAVCMQSPLGVTETKGSDMVVYTQQDKAKMKLSRSHFFPNSILKKFSKAHPLPSDHQTIVDLYVKGTKSDRLRSARQVTYFMLCFPCEGIISRNGEEQFPSLFFDKIYDQNDPFKSKTALKIEYGRWLYTFCLGIIFRTLHLHAGYYVNEDEVYQLLVQCRTCLLNIDSVQSIDNKPEIFLLVSPLFASEEDMAYGYMNRVLNNTNAACLRDISLDSGAAQQMYAHFFIVHMGVINILVKFSPAESVKIPKEYLVCPDGGVYTVPPDETRKQLLPVGVWKLFQLIAQDIEMREREYPIKLNEKLNKKPSRQPSDNVKSVFGIVEGTERDKQAIYAQEGVTPSPSTSVSKKLNLLPSVFQVKPSFHPSAVLLPQGHHILLHYTEYLHDTNRQSVLFLCTGNDRNYSSDKPYIIWHYEGPGFTCDTGFFISTVDMSATEFLPDDNPKAMLKNTRPESLAPFVKRLPELLPKMLELKGFYSLQSLLLRGKALRSTACNFDRKCSSKKRCWYCYTLCNTCLKNPSVFGLTKSGPNEERFNFCSSECQKFHPEGSIVTKSMLFVDSSGEQHQLVGRPVSATPLRCAPISSSHKEVAHIYIIDKDEEGYPLNTEISLCKGDGTELFPEGRLYVVFCQQTLHYQRFLEYFIASDFSPEEPLPYLKHEKIKTELNKISVQNYIQEAVIHGLKYDIEST